MLTSLKVAEIIVRIIIIVVQVLGIIGGGLVIGLLSDSSSEGINYLAYGIGGMVIGISGLIFIYEILMIAMSFIKKVNQTTRLLVDLICSSVMSILCGFLTVVAIALAVLLIVLLILLRDLGLLVPLPIVFGILTTIVFIISVISSGVIRSKITSQSRAETNQSAPATVGITPTTFMMVQQPISHPQSFSDADYPPPAYYSTVGDSEGATGIPQNAYDCLTAGGGVEVPYYHSQALPGEN